MTNDERATDDTTDPAFIAELVRRVLARLQDNESTYDSTRVVTVETIEKQSGTKLIVARSAVVTPAARDEARRRGIVIERTTQSKQAINRTANTNVTDTDHSERAEAIRLQLDRRGVVLDRERIVLSDSPAREVHDQITSGNCAAMITEIADVQRFANELSPSVWVLDMKRLNIAAAVNTVVKISQQERR